MSMNRSAHLALEIPDSVRMAGWRAALVALRVLATAWRTVEPLIAPLRAAWWLPILATIFGFSLGLLFAAVP